MRNIFLDPIEAANGRAPTQSENPVNMDTEIDGLLDGIINTNRGIYDVNQPDVALFQRIQ